MTLNWISSFLEAMQAERGATENTVLAYGRDLKDLLSYLQNKGTDFKGADQGVLRSYLTELLDQGASESTVARRLSSLRQLYQFAFEEGWRKDNPATLIKGPKKRRHLPATLSAEAVEKLLETAAQTGRNPAERMRNACLLHLLYATGLRVSELVSLPAAALRGNPEMILVRGKGGRERLVPLSPPARMTGAAWLAERDRLENQAAKEKGQAKSPFLFPSSGKSGHLTRVGFFLLIKDIAVKAGLDPSKISPHVMRHAFASHLLAGGADLRIIQTLLGHADIATTEIYTHVLGDRLVDLVTKHHPLSKGGAG